MSVWDLNYSAPGGGLNSIVNGNAAGGAAPMRQADFMFGDLGSTFPGLGEAGGGGLFDFNFGNMDFGKMSGVMSGISGLADSWMAMKKLDLLEEQFAFQKDAFNKNYNAQVKTANTNMADRQKRRLSADPNNYASVSDYMAKNGL